MGRPKKYLTVTISLGKPGDPARMRVEEFIKLHGSRKLSPWIRECIINSTDSQAYEKREAIAERKKINKELEILQKRLQINNDQLEKFGIVAIDIK